MAKTSKTKRQTAVSAPKRADADSPLVESATRSPFTLKAPWPVVLGLVLLLVILLFLRRHFIDLPLERDESAYAYLGKRTLEGLIPYRDFYEMKPPFLFYSYAALVAVFGYSVAGIHWAAVILCYWNSAFVFAIGARLMGYFYGFVAASAYVLLVSNPYSSAVLLESETVLMAFILPGLYALFRWEYAQTQAADATTGSRKFRNGLLFLTGCLLACGTLLRQTGIFFFGVAALLPVAVWWQQTPRQVGRLAAWAARIAAGAALPVVLSFGAIAASGAWADFWFWNVDYIGKYATALAPEIWKAAFEFAWKQVSGHFEWYWYLGGAGVLCLLLPRMAGRYRLSLLALALLSFAAITPGKRFYGHYWLQLLPAVALLIGVFFYTLEKSLASVLPRVNWRPVSAGAACLLLAFPVLRNAPLLFRSDGDKLLREMFPGNPNPEDKVLAGFIAERIQPEDRIAVLGSEPQYYVYLNKKAPSRHFYMAFCMRPIEESAAWQQEALDSIIQQKPRFIVFNFIEYSWMPKKDSKMILYKGSYKYARNHYRPVAWADLTSLSDTKYVLDEQQARDYKPTGQRYVTVYERRDDLPDELPDDSTEEQ